MTSLYKRATPRQQLVLRIVEGAVKNAHDAHGLEFSPRLARSIAKRAAGTLTAQWPDVLAAALQPPSDRAESHIDVARRAGSELNEGRGSSQVAMASSVRQTSPMANRRGASVSKRSPLRLLWKRLAYKAGEAKRAGEAEKLAGIVVALKLVAALQRETA